MSQRLTYTKAHKLYLLHEQLLAAGITPETVEGSGNNIYITVADGVNPASVQAVVTAHDPSVLSAAEVIQQELTTARDDLRNQYNVGITRLNDIITNGPTYTAAQVRDAMVDLAVIQKRVLRLLKDALT